MEESSGHSTKMASKYITSQTPTSFGTINLQIENKLPLIAQVTQGEQAQELYSWQ